MASVSVPAGDMSALQWLRSQEGHPRSYWSGRDDGCEAASVGVADVLSGDTIGDLDVLQERLALLSSGDTEARYYGGMRFDALRKADEDWAVFGGHRFVLPRIELRREGEEAVLACNLVLPRDVARADEIIGEIQALRPVGAFEDWLETPVERVDKPELADWGSNIETALAAFEEGSLEKVVLARRATFSFREDVDALSLVERLKAKTPGCFHFFFEPEPGVAFLGASPERLFRGEGRLVKSEAVAGTRPRGGSAKDDAAFGEELMQSRKDLAEQSYVRRGIEQDLGSLCERFEVDGRASEMKLARGRHLVSQVRGVLREGVAHTDVLRALHPTPAVGGYPKAAAVEWIGAAEPFDRGWYAGPVGWIGAESAEFAVGIRSGLARGRELSLFSGAGIVAGSVPEEEWAEIEQKIGDFTRVFGLEPAHARG